MSHADAAAAAPPVALRTVRNRLRSIGRASVVTQRAVARDAALHVAVDAPAHRQRGNLVHLRHGAHVTVAGAAALGAKTLMCRWCGKRTKPGSACTRVHTGGCLVAHAWRTFWISALWVSVEPPMI